MKEVHYINDGGALRLNGREIVIAFVALLAIFLLGLLAVHFTRPTVAPIVSSAPPTGALAQAPSLGQTYPDDLGMSIDEVDSLVDNGPDADKESKRFKQIIRPYLHDPQWLSVKFKIPGSSPAFVFPSDFYLGAIKIGNGTPLVAQGKINALLGQPIALYLPRVVTDCPQLLDKFGPDDIDSLAGVFTRPSEIITRVSGWHHLRGLSFFNPLVKAPPNCEEWDESGLSNRDLAAVDRLENLKLLGLCGPDVTGTAVSQMVLLNRLESLQLKRISDLSSLLAVLPHFDNIKELWLVGQDLTDDQLQSLTRMKGLKTLRIRRSKLTPASLAAFKKMPALEELWLDRNTWTDRERILFKKEIPGCHFEKVVDYTYWHMVAK